MNKLKTKIVIFFQSVKMYLSECVKAYQAYTAAEASMKAFADQARRSALILDHSPNPMHEHSFAAFALLRKLYDLSVLDEDWNIQIGELLQKAEADSVNYRHLLMRDAAQELFSSLKEVESILADDGSVISAVKLSAIKDRMTYALKKAQGLL